MLLSRLTEKTFVIATMATTLLVAMLSAWFKWGYLSAFMLAIGMFTVLGSFAIFRKDAFLQKLLMFGLIAGFVELAADNWLVNTIQSLVYPASEPKIWASPNYMPFAWAVILVQVGYLGYLVSKKHNMLKAMLVSFCIGMCFIPVFETLAKYAGWWYYHPTRMLGNTPWYIIVGEGIICFTLPFIFRKELRGSMGTSLLAGIIQGVWIWGAYWLAHTLIP